VTIALTVTRARHPSHDAAFSPRLRSRLYRPSRLSFNPVSLARRRPDSEDSEGVQRHCLWRFSGLVGSWSCFLICSLRACGSHMDHFLSYFYCFMHVLIRRRAGRARRACNASYFSPSSSRVSIPRVTSSPRSRPSSRPSTLSRHTRLVPHGRS
jgi:hypothetical protein